MLNIPVNSKKEGKKKLLMLLYIMFALYMNTIPILS